MFFIITGVILLTSILGVFWLKDRLQSPLLARFAYSGLVARLAVVSAAFIILGLLIILSELLQTGAG